MSSYTAQGSRHLLVLVGFLSVLMNCGKQPLAPENNETGAIELRALITKQALPKTKESTQTTFDSVIVEIRSADAGLQHFSIPLSNANPVVIDTLRNVPVGNNRSVTVWTVNNEGAKIHTDSVTSHLVHINSSSITTINATLLPAAGSIYIQIGSVPTDVEIVRASFISTNGTIWSDTARRTPKVNLSLDNIPHETSGRLCVAGMTLQGDTLYKSQSDMVFNARQSGYVNLAFQASPGQLGLHLNINLPEVTLFTGLMGSTSLDTSESGDIIITEIMYTANDSEYIEIYNPSTTILVFDTLMVELDGNRRVLSNVTLSPLSYYVIGRRVLPWVNSAFSTETFFDLTANGNWIKLRNSRGAVLDEVLFTGGSNTLEWPNVSGKRSIILDTTAYDVHLNNLGRSWHGATSFINGSEAQSGTPGTL